MVKLEFKLDGKTMSPNDLGVAIKAKMHKIVKEKLLKAFKSVKCKNHSDQTIVTVKAKGNKLDFTVSSCCDDFNEKVKSVIDKIKF